MEMGLNAAHQYSYRELLAKKRLERELQLAISANGLTQQLFVIGQPAPERFSPTIGHSRFYTAAPEPCPLSYVTARPFVGQ